MKKLFILPVLALLIFVSCKKTKIGSSETTIGYVVTADSSAAKLIVGYNNVYGLYESRLRSAMWDTAFVITDKPFAASLDATIYPGSPVISTTVTIKIVVNNQVAKEATTKLDAFGTHSLQVDYTVQ